MIAWSFWDGQIVWIEALSYIGLYAVYVAYLYFDNKKMNRDSLAIDEVVAEVEELEEEAESRFPILRSLNSLIALTYPKTSEISNKTRYTFWMSIVWIVFLSWVLVKSGVLLAHTLGVSEVIIGLTILAA